MKKVKLILRNLWQMVTFGIALYLFGVPLKVIGGILLLLYFAASLMTEYKEHEATHDR